MPDPIANTVGTKVIENLIDRILNFILNPITVRITVVRNCKENIENLKGKVEELTNEKNRVENYKKDVERRGAVVDDRIQTWLTKAHEFVKAAEESVRVGDEFAKECFFQLCPNPVSRYKLSKKAGQNSQSIAKLVQEARGFDLPLSHPPPPQQDVVAVVEGFEKFPSRMAVLDQIMEALRNPMVNKIGVHGTSGVGKTMLVKMVKGKAKQDSLFTDVVMATVTKDRDLKSIQEDIARDLGMDQLSFKELTDRQVADRIKERLINVKKFLVILDDIWEPEIDFEKFGIPSESELKQHVKKKNEESSFGQDMLCKTEIDFEESGVPCASELKHHAKKENEESSSGQDMHYKTEIDFEESGIPSASELKQHTKKKNEESSSGQEDMLCRILLTSRYPDVLSSIMGEKDQVFEVHKLEDDEAWHLFKKIAGSYVESSDFQPAAKEIVENCLGLPVAIASVGKAMKGKTRQHQWQTALMELKRPTPEGISAAVYNPIELSYKYLQGDELKLTFMLCSLLGQDSSINDLLKYGMSLNLFRKVRTMEQTRAKVLTLVHSLKQSSLLVDGHSNMHFGMHDQIRLVALSIASREHDVLALTDEDVGQEWPDKEIMEKLKWIYLSNGYPELISNGLKCPQLTFFHLSNKGCSLAFPTDLFTGTGGLKVLCLTKIDFQSMPSQIPLIPTKLQTLLLDQCVLRVEELGTIMGNLENLEVLSLAGCDIEELPREMEKLTKLKLLDVSDCTKLKVIPRQVLARLSKLEELKMGNSFDQWDDVEGGNARLAELTELHKLSALEVRIRNFQGTLLPENLVSFKIFIGVVRRDIRPSWNSYSWNSSFESSKIMKLKLQGASIKSNDSIKKLLKKTEELYLEGLNGVESLVDELDDEGFKHLKCLRVQYAPDIRHIFNPAGRSLPSHVFPILEELTLFNLEKMEKICHGLTGAAPFKVLRKITVDGCHELKNLFSFSMAGQLQLQEITVEGCNNIQQVIDDVEEQGNENDITEESEGCKLGSLRSLTLTWLPKLISFNSNCSDISLFNDKVVFPNLEELELLKIKINQLWITSSCVENPQEILDFTKLKCLKISLCSSLKYLFTLSMVSGFVKLEDLQVFSCHDLKQVIMVRGIEEVVNTELIFPRLNSISLEYCSKLSSFYTGSYTLKFQSVRELTIRSCQNMITFASTFSTKQEKETAYQGTEGRLAKKEPGTPSQTLFCDAVEFPKLELMELYSMNIHQIWHNQISENPSSIQKLKKLVVEDCNNLKYLLTSSMLKSFKQLTMLKICDCKMMEGVILTEELGEEERMKEIFFPKLDSLVLQKLPKLARFCSGNFFEFSSLTQLTIIGCSMLRTFITNYVIGDTTTSTESAPSLFDEKVAFPKLEHLIIEFMETLNKIWNALHDADSCCELKYVHVNSCGKLLNIFPFSMMKMLQRLARLDICNCNSLEEIFESQGLGASQSKSHINTKTTSVETAPKFLFPKLAFLDLYNLPKLKHFCHQMHTTEWPSLKRLKVCGCNQVQIFALEIPSLQRIEGDNQFEIQNIQSSLFWVSKDTFPSLEELELEWNDNMKELWYGQHLEEYFGKLKVVKFIYFPEGSTFLPPFFFQSVPNLKKLIVRDDSSREVFQRVDVGVEEKPFECRRTPLYVLRLSELHKLTHLWKEKSQIEPVFSNLKALKVEECSGLKNLVPPTVHFNNLQTLEISECHGLANLVRYSTAESLVQLTRMKISDCNRITEIVSCTDGEVKGAIIFCQLKYLQLFGLPRLVSFCSVECNFEFPCLEEVIVEKCPRMKIFSVGEVRTSQLKRVQFKEDKDTWRWEGDLNTTIQKLFTEKVVCSGLENLCLQWDDNPLVEIWNENPQEIFDFEKLKCLEFINCSSLKYLLTPSMVSSLVQLQDLKLKNCSAMEQVITVKEVEEGAETELIFPRLNSILLVSCSNLTSFCAATYPLKFPSVIEIAIRDCPNMATFASPFSREHEKEIAKGESEEKIEKEEPDIPTEPFLSDKVHFSILERLELTSVGIHQICHSQVPRISPFVENLTELTVGRCFNLKYLMTFSMFKSFVQLKKLKIFKCKILEGVILMEGLAEEERMFPKLERLELFDLPKLKRFCSYSDSPEEIYDPQGVNDSGLQATQSTLVQTTATKVVFPRVTYLKLSHLPALKISCPQEDVAKWPLLKYVQATFPCLEELELGWNDIMNEIWYGQHPEEYFCKLKALKLLGFPAFLRPFFFQSLPNLEKLVVIDSFFSELFQCEEVGIEEKPVCGQTLLRELKLSKLHELTHLWKEESQLEPVFNNLRTLVVRKCGKLNNLVPSAVYFENLQTLKVSQCHGLVNLVRYSTAKSLVQLTRLQVINCKMIEEIVGCSSDDVKGDIVFTKLEYLRFKGLPRLASFCSGSCNFIFPSLEVVIVRECSKMQNFSVGEVITTKLQKVKLTAYDFGGRWGGNLNHTIQQLFTEKSASDSEDEYSEEDYSEDEYSEEEYSEEEYSEEESD